jgi:hypothetical protein
MVISRKKLVLGMNRRRKQLSQNADRIFAFWTLRGSVQNGTSYQQIPM